MSSIIQSENDSSSSNDLSSSSSSSLNDSIKSNRVIDDNNQIEPKIPLSTSIILNQKQQIQKIQQTQIQGSEEKIPQIQSLNEVMKRDENIMKISVKFHSIGSTPKISPNNFKILSNQTISTLSKFLVKKLKLKNEIIYLYIQNSFQPTPDEKIGDLFNLFQTNNELTVNYCYNVAFG